MKAVKVGKWLFRISLLSLFIYFMLTSFEWRNFLQTGSQLINNPFIIISIFLFYYCSFLLKAVAWQLYFRKKISITSSMVGIFYSLLINHLLPFKVGDVVRAMVLASREKEITSEHSFHSVFVLRIMDILSLAIIAGIGILYYQTGVTISIYMVGVALFVGSLSILFLKRKFPDFFERNIQLFLHAFSGRNGMFIFLLVFSSWLLEATVLFGVTKVVLQPLAPFEAIWVNGITIIGQMFQFTPGGITTYEAVMSYALTFLSVPVSVGLMIAIYSHALKFVFAYLVGIYLVIRYPITIGTMKQWLSLKGVTEREKRI